MTTVELLSQISSASVQHYTPAIASFLDDILQESQVAAALRYQILVKFQVQRPNSHYSESLRIVHHHKHEQDFLARSNVRFVPF